MDADGIRRKIAGLGTIMGIWAHPDDETFSMAGVMAVAAQAGQKVACITATKGEAGVQDESRWPAATLGETRAAELTAALKLLGVKDHHWLGYPDGGCKNIDDDKAVSDILPFIKQYQPDTIITFPPDGMTGHDDHVCISRWARLATRLSGVNAAVYYAVDTQEMYDRYLRQADEKFNIFFNIDQPVLVPEADCDLVFKFPDDIVDAKLAALKAMPSQTAGMFEGNGNHWMEAALCCEAFVSEERTAEFWPRARSV